MPTDVFDSAQWKKSVKVAEEVAGTSNPKTIRLLFCTDGFPVFNYAGSLSMQPGMSMVLSLPPWERYKVDNIIISVLIPSELSAASQKKFFDKIVEVDFNPMIRDGISGCLEGETVRVEVFAQVRFLFSFFLLSCHRCATHYTLT